MGTHSEGGHIEPDISSYSCSVSRSHVTARVDMLKVLIGQYNLADWAILTGFGCHDYTLFFAFWVGQRFIAPRLFGVYAMQRRLTSLYYHSYHYVVV